MISVIGDPRTEQQRVLLRVRQEPDHREQPEAEAGARPDDQAQRDLTAHVRRERVLDRAQERRLVRSRREPPVDPAAEPLHVEEHVDRHDEQQHRAEQRLADRDRRALDERDDPVRVLADVAPLDLTHEPVTALLDLHRLQVVAVEPALEAIDVEVRGRPSGRGVRMREVVVEPGRRGLRLRDDGGGDGEDDQREHREERQVHERDREAARELDPLQRPDDRIEQQRHERRHHEQEDDVNHPRREHPHEEQRGAAARRAGPSAGSASEASRRRCYWPRRTDPTARLGLGCSFDGPCARPWAFTRLKPDDAFATVPAMSPPVPHRRARACTPPAPGA